MFTLSYFHHLDVASVFQGCLFTLHYLIGKEKWYFKYWYFMTYGAVILNFSEAKLKDIQ